MQTRPLEVFVTIAALGGLVYLFWQTRSSAPASPATIAAATQGTVTELGQEVGPRPDATYAQEQALSQWVINTGATDPDTLSNLVDNTLTQPDGVALFFGAPGGQPSPMSSSFASI